MQANGWIASDRARALPTNQPIKERNPNHANACWDFLTVKRPLAVNPNKSWHGSGCEQYLLVRWSRFFSYP
jgi:hypothetical protein